MLPYTIVYYVALLVGGAAGLETIAPIAFTTIEAILTGNLLDNAVKLGLKLDIEIPEGLVRIASK